MVSVRPTFSGVFKSNLGVYCVLPLIDSVDFGHRITFYRSVAKYFFSVHAGSITPLYLLKASFVVSNIGFIFKDLVTSPGTYAKIRLVRYGSCVLILPSGFITTISSKAYAMVGRNCGGYSYKQILGKASTDLGRGRRIIVRSSAKNPVDHPNGGRTRGKM